MKKIIILLGLLLTISNVSLAKEVEWNPNSKIGSNLLSLVLIGDINAFYEHPMAKQFSIVSTVHYISSETFNQWDTDFRVSLGIRGYSLGDIFNFGLNVPTHIKELKPSLTGNFFELKTGLIRINGTVRNTFEFGGGYSQMFNKSIYYEWKLGLARILGEDNAVLPLAAFGIGLII